MMVYYYKYMDMWLTCRAKSKSEVERKLGDIWPECILTEREAKKRAERDPELADFIRSTWLCELMCN